MSEHVWCELLLCCGSYPPKLVVSNFKVEKSNFQKKNFNLFDFFIFFIDFFFLVILGGVVDFSKLSSQYHFVLVAFVTKKVKMIWGLFVRREGGGIWKKIQGWKIWKISYSRKLAFARKWIQETVWEPDAMFLWHFDHFYNIFTIFTRFSILFMVLLTFSKKFLLIENSRNLNRIFEDFRDLFTILIVFLVIFFFNVNLNNFYDILKQF